MNGMWGFSFDPTGAPGQVAVDDVVTDSTIQKPVAVTRLDGPGPFAFGLSDGDGGPPPSVAGPAFVVTAFATVPATGLTRKWMQTFQVGGVLPNVASAATSSLSDDLGFGAILGPEFGFAAKMRTVTFSFTGTLKVAGMPDVDAPANSYATALIVFDSVTGNILVAKVFPRGPKSVGRPSHARAFLRDLPTGASPTDFQIVYVDTVWDTLSLDGTHSVASQQGGDVVVAILDSTGKPVKVAQYGGPGDDEPLGVDSEMVVFGRSNGPIDFGNGVLKPSAGGSMLWFASLSNLH
jgi:hypothetical protein